MSARMQVVISTPAGTETLEAVHLRLEALDGSRGVLPGHEPARLCFVAGPIELTLASDGTAPEASPPGRDASTRPLEYVVTEGGVAEIEPSCVTLVCRWAARDVSLAALQQQVRDRRTVRALAEREAQAVAHRHEMATRRALAGLRREVPG